MAFSSFDVTLTRLELGLGTLDLNDHANYLIAENMMGAAQTWNRQTVKSPFVDGEFTVHRAKAQRQETLAVQVLGGTQTILQANLKALTDALSQFRFTWAITMDETNRSWSCETADYTVDFSRDRWMAHKVLVTAQIPVYPL